MSIITIISHPKKDGAAVSQLAETRREFDSFDEAIAYIEALRDGPVKAHDGTSES